MKATIVLGVVFIAVGCYFYISGDLEEKRAVSKMEIYINAMKQNPIDENARVLAQDDDWQRQNRRKAIERVAPEKEKDHLIGGGLAVLGLILSAVGFDFHRKTSRASKSPEQDVPPTSETPLGGN